MSILRGNIKYPFGISSNKRKAVKAFNNDDYSNSLYLRFEVKDKQGVLSSITNRLAKYKISVKRLIQTPDKKNNKATIVIITHKTSEINCHNCLSIFKKNKGLIQIRTYENGVGETLSCGSASLCVAAKFLNQNKNKLKVSSMGGELRFKLDKNGILMSGPASFSYKGNINE